MTALRPLRVGVTIGLRSCDESLWTNGIKQNALFLAKLFQNSPLGHDVHLLNTTDVAISDALPWRLDAFPTSRLLDRLDDLDVVIELGGQIHPELVAYLKARGVKLVSYCCGPEYVLNAEAIIFRRPLWDSVYINTDFDELWIIPQVAETSFGFLETYRRRPARIAPFVWDPSALDSAVGERPERGEYRPHDGPKRLSVIEPNIDVLKFCLYPVLIAERAFREAPDRISFLHVANADVFVREEREFAGLMRPLDIVRARKASFIGRVETPRFLADHTDIVVSHQWGLALNYFHLECCWQGYPLVHNAHLISDLGYYYPGSDVAAGADRLIEALVSHDETWRDYAARQRSAIARFLSSDAGLVTTYDAMLANLFAP